jgi:hypothetical protein
MHAPEMAEQTLLDQSFSSSSLVSVLNAHAYLANLDTGDTWAKEEAIERPNTRILETGSCVTAHETEPRTSHRAGIVRQ